MKTALQIISLLAGVFGLALSFIGIVGVEFIFLMWGVIFLGLSFFSNYLLDEYL